jgi:ankyrin repeat protein
MAYKSFWQYLIAVLSMTPVAYGMESDPNEQLMDAINDTNIMKIEELLNNEEIDINYKTSSKATPLMHAVNKENLEIAQLLINKGADINAIDSMQWSALHYACEKTPEKHSLAQLLIRQWSKY